MSKKKAKRKSSNENPALTKLIFATAILNLIKAVIDLIKDLA